MRIADLARLRRQFTADAFVEEIAAAWRSRLTGCALATVYLAIFASPWFVLGFGGVQVALYVGLVEAANARRSASRSDRVLALMSGLRFAVTAHACVIGLVVDLCFGLTFAGPMFILTTLILAAFQPQPTPRAYVAGLVGPVASFLGLAVVRQPVDLPARIAFSLLLLMVVTAAARQQRRRLALASLRADEAMERARLVERARESAIAEEVAAMGFWRIRLPEMDHSWSAGVFRIFGLPQADHPPAIDDVIGFYRPADREAVARAVETALAERSGFAFEHVIVRADGAERRLRLKAHFDEEGGERGSLFGVVQDVTEEHLALAAAEESEARHRFLADNTADMISRYGLDGRITFVTPSCAAVLGYAPEELVGLRTYDFAHPDDAARVFAECAAHIAAGPTARPIKTQLRARHKDGRWIWLEGSPRVVRGAGGEPRELVDVVRDITDRKGLERELRKAREEAASAAAVKAEFLANMSHELRTPLTSIVGFSDLLARDENLSPTARDHVRRVSTSSRALRSTVNDILDFSALEAGEVRIRPAPTDVATLCAEALETFSAQAHVKGLELSLVTAELPGRLAVDPGRLLQILLNLIGNAVKFTENGSVSVSARHTAGRLRLEVVDTGQGVPDAALDKLFRRFSQVDGSSTRTHGGTGLGLAICKGLIERMDGTISLESRQGEGSRFTVELPAPLAEIDDDDQPLATALTEALDGVRVLVVDDNAANREIVQRIGDVSGFEVTRASSGREALEIASLQPFDVVLLDLRMPELDGSAVLRRLRQAPGPNDLTPVLAYTADIGSSDVARWRREGFDGVVGKPVSARDLLHALAEAVRPAPHAEGDVRVG